MKISQYQPFPTKCTLLHRFGSLFLPIALTMVFVTGQRHCRVTCAEQGLHQHLLWIPFHRCWLRKWDRTWLCQAEVSKLALTQKPYWHNTPFHPGQWRYHINSASSPQVKSISAWHFMLWRHGLRSQSWPCAGGCPGVSWSPFWLELSYGTVKLPILKSDNENAKLLPICKKTMSLISAIFSSEEDISSHRYRAK